MASANNNLRITELDFDSIKQNIKNYLKSQSEFSDYDFEGSGLSVLLDVLAYNTHYSGMYVNLIGNEMFLDTAQLRASLMSHAKMTNYIPTSRRGSKAVVDIIVTPGTGESNTIPTLILPRYTKFFSTDVDGIVYSFVNTEAQYTEKANNAFTYKNVTLTEGELVEQTILVTDDNTRRRFTIPNRNVDTSTIIVSVQASEVDNTSSVYTLAGDINLLTSNSEVYFIEENAEANGSWTLYFGDNYLGKKPASNNVINLKYLVSKGAESVGSRDFRIIEDIGPYSANIIVTTVDVGRGGSEKETLEEVRFRAPIHYTTQNRAVTKNDYGVLLLKDYPAIESVSVWGGEENDPVVYGKIFVSMKPKDGYDLSLIEKQRIADKIIRERSVLTVFPEIVEPDYTYLKIDAKINYNPKLTSKSEGELKEIARNAILNYKDQYLKQFNSTFRQSVLQRILDTSETSFISSELNLYLQKRFEPTIDASLNYYFDFGQEIAKEEAFYKVHLYPTFSVANELNTFNGVYLEEVPKSITGISSISVLSAGSNYTTTPTVTITGDGTGAKAVARIVNGKVATITVTDRGSNYTTAIVTISGGNGFGATAKAILDLNVGNLRTFYVKTNGEKVVINSNAGEINYLTGKITLSSFKPTAIASNPYYTNSTLTLNVPPKNTIIQPNRNRILDIDETDSSSILITLIPEA